MKEGRSCWKSDCFGNWTVICSTAASRALVSSARAAARWYRHSSGSSFNAEAYAASSLAMVSRLASSGRMDSRFVSFTHAAVCVRYPRRIAPLLRSRETYATATASSRYSFGSAASSVLLSAYRPACKSCWMRPAASGHDSVTARAVLILRPSAMRRPVSSNQSA